MSYLASLETKLKTFGLTVYKDEAKAGAALPYIVYKPSIPSNTFDTLNGSVNIEVLSKQQSQVYSVITAMRKAFKDYSITTSEHSFSTAIGLENPLPTEANAYRRELQIELFILETEG